MYKQELALNNLKNWYALKYNQSAKHLKDYFVLFYICVGCTDKWIKNKFIIKINKNNKRNKLY